MSPRSTTRPLYFGCFASNSAFFKWQMSISEAKWTFCALRPCFIDDLFFTSDFRQVPRRNLFQFLIFFINCCLRCGNLQGKRHRNKFVYQIAMLQWISPLSCNMVLMMIRWRFFHTQSCGFTGFQKYTQVFDLISLDLPRVAPCLHVLLVLQGIAGAIRVSNFLRAFLMVFFELLVLRVKKINSS